MQYELSVGLRQVAVTGATCAAAFLIWTAYRLYPESSPVARGAESAHMHDCIECHGQPGTSAADETAPGCKRRHPDPTHPGYEGACRDLQAYFEVVRVKRSFEIRLNAGNPNRLMLGEQLARKYSCFQCHGELGQGGRANSRALKGYIPGYFGNDFASLTRGGRKNSIRDWIRDGMDAALLDPPVSGSLAAFFLKRQSVSMPSYRTLPGSEIEILVDYVQALSRFGEMDASDIRLYGRQTQRHSPREMRVVMH